MDAIFIILTGIAIGFLVGWFIAKSKFESGNVIGQDDLNNIIELNKQVATKEQVIENLNKQLEQHEEKLKTEFENLANKILKQNTAEFAEANQKKLTDILNPLKEKITKFENKVDETYVKGTRERSALVEQIKNLTELNKQMSEDTTNLTKALKGESKTQGEWGEIRLELILEKAGLERNIHYSKQETYKDESGRDKRPDFVINLPDNKHLVIDSKMSLKAYEQYFNCSDDNEKAIYLKNHLESIREHVKDLSSKSYQNLYQINTPDYVLMYIPIEPAFTLAIQSDIELMLWALEKKNVVMVTTSTLLATLSTVSSIWKQEDQKKYVQEIARQSGALYDKFVGFVNDLLDIGKRMNSAKTAYDDAMNKLSTGSGNLIKRAENIKKLGAKTTKSLPQPLLDKAEDEGADDTLLTVEKPQIERS